MASGKKGIHISSRQLFIGTVLSYILALTVFMVGWFKTGPHWLAIACCLPLLILIPAVLQKRRRYYQLIPNLLVIYICWSLAERFINPDLQTYAAIALILWSACLVLMLMLVRTSYLIDGGHYIPDPERKQKREQRRQEKLNRKQK
jgi:uncharacterized membrane protein